MDKIGIITFHKAINYGAILQAVALQRAIKKLGGNAELIDYVDRLYNHYKILYKTSSGVKTVLKYLLSGKVRLRNKRFERFLYEHVDVSQHTYSRKTICEIDENEYRMFITGSDQVFNPQIVDYDENYLLGFVENKSKCNSYAASIGVSQLAKKDQEWLARYIQNYNEILVREKTGLELLQQMGITRGILVADPTFLLEKTEWESMEHKVKTPKHYILCYGFKKSDVMEKCANLLSENKRIPICVISDKIVSERDSKHQMRGVGPAEWLYLIHHADYIVTNSFHGMIFSFIYNKQVWIADSEDGTFSRMEDFLAEMGCKNRILDVREDVSVDNSIDYSIVEERLDKYVSKSLNELKKMVCGSEDGKQ